jgi:hypothetical protein
MRILATVFFAILCIEVLGGDEPDFNVNNIPENLRNDAIAVIRLDRQELTIKNKGSANLTVEYAITILNENAKELGYFVQSYSKYVRCTKYKGEIFDKSGERFRKIRLEEFHDVSNIAAYSLYEDQRVIYSMPETNNYPYTVYYTYEIELKGILSLPSWVLLPDYNVSLEKGSYQVKIKPDLNLQFHSISLDVQAEENIEDDMKTYTWEVNNLEVLKEEPYSKTYADIFPQLNLNLQEFEFAGTSGSFASWEEFGDWVWSLLNEKEVFTSETEEEIKARVANCTSIREKVDSLYNYMQNKVRYVNIAVGLGGFEPIPAQRVHEVGYGDCKALTNYMRSMLHVVGVNSVYTLVYGSTSPRTVVSEHPSQQFNHVILMVPDQNDSIWLECTSQRLPSNYIGVFTDDRTVLFVHEDGSHLGRTPAFTIQENLTLTKAHVLLDENLNATITRDRIFKGKDFYQNYQTFLSLDEIEQKRNIINNLKLSGFILNSYSYKYNLHEPITFSEHIEITDDAVTAMSGEYIFLPAILVSENIRLPARLRSRKQDVFIRRGEVSIDSIHISYPETFDLLELPASVSIESRYGSYTSSITKTDSGILFIRVTELKKGTYLPEEYESFYRFFRDMFNADKQVLSFKLASSG